MKPCLTDFLSRSAITKPTKKQTKVYKRCTDWQEAKKRRIEIQREHKENQQQNKCTFKPQITHPKKVSTHIKSNEHAQQQHIMRQYMSAKNKLDELEREMKRPGSGQLWNSKLTQPLEYQFRSLERSLDRQQKKLRQASAKRVMTQSAEARTTIINFNISNQYQTKTKCKCNGETRGQYSSSERDTATNQLLVSDRALCSVPQKKHRRRNSGMKPQGIVKMHLSMKPQAWATKS